MTRPSRLLFLTERALLAIGIASLGIYAAGLVDRLVLSRFALRDFDKGRVAVVRGPESPPGATGGNEVIDFSLWSRKRIVEFHETLSIRMKPPVAVLQVEKLNIRVPVFEGTDDLVLNRGVGWITGTARPGESGNVGLAGHRDGFFRGLKDIVAGDRMHLATGASVATYAVDEIEIVNPDNVGVLAPRRSPSLTLVTCYPFFFVGKAPQRFIVHAVLKEKVSAN
jgi:sortase A